MDGAFFVSHLDGVPDVEAERLQPFTLHLDLWRFDVPAAEVMVFALSCACFFRIRFDCIKVCRGIWGS